ncbi:MAG: hypothetical protein WDM96_02265 [Lacunisphaera sp.]
MSPRYLTVLAVTVLLAALPGRADEATDRWVAKARAYLGNAAALDAVRSLHFQGSFPSTEQAPDPADPQKTVEQPVRVTIDIIFQQPMRQRQVLRSDRVERVTALDGYDGWERVADLTGKNAARLTLLDAMSIKRLRATTIENLSFYSNRAGSSRQVQFLGEETVDGVPCAKLSFTHGGNIVFSPVFRTSHRPPGEDGRGRGRGNPGGGRVHHQWRSLPEKGDQPIARRSQYDHHLRTNHR